MTYHVNNTYAKLAPDTQQNKRIKEIMRYTGGHRTSPFSFIVHFTLDQTGVLFSGPPSKRNFVAGEHDSFIHDLACPSVLNNSNFR